MIDLALTATGWMDGLWDDAAGLLRYPDRDWHAIRESAWYALGLILRDEPGDIDRARRALVAVIANQFHAPGTVFHGTFARAPEEPYPPANPVQWQDYDPNWRQFIGCTFALLIDGFADAVGTELCRSMVQSVLLAVDGEPPDRVVPSYSNIALMRAWLDGWSGTHQRAESLARAVARDVDEKGGFAEFNSPTYYGIDLFALALWRTRPPTELFRTLAHTLEARLWRDISDFYHWDLRNLCGPYTRSYGMDAKRYIALFGMYLPGALPDLNRPFDHALDLCFAPLAALVTTEPPDGALHPRGPRTIARAVAGMQVTARLEDDAMWGGLALYRARHPQIHPATAHWRTADGDTGWLRVRSRGRLEAVALDDGLFVDVGEDGATAEIFPDASSIDFSRGPREIEGSKLRFGPGELEISLAR